MRPTLVSLDALKIAPYNKKKIRSGDVVVFVRPGSSQKVAHRVISVKSEKILTRGDNNNKVDRLSISASDIVGRVVYAKRGEIQSRIYGGSIGQVYASLIRAKKLSGRMLSFLFGPAYRRLAKTGMVLRLVPCREKIRTVVYKRPHGEEIQLFMGGLLVARRKPRSDKWDVKRPFRLFVEDYINIL